MRLLQLRLLATMAEGGAGSLSPPEEGDVRHLLTPLSTLNIDSAAIRRDKRGYTSPTGLTPRSKLKRVSARSRFSARKRLPWLRSSPKDDHSNGPSDEIASTTSTVVASTAPPAGTWSDSEIKALLEFLLFHKGPGTKWFKRETGKDFWIAAARFVQTRVKTPLPRSCTWLTYHNHFHNVHRQYLILCT